MDTISPIQTSFKKAVRKLIQKEGLLTGSQRTPFTDHLYDVLSSSDSIQSIQSIKKSLPSFFADIVDDETIRKWDLVLYEAVRLFLIHRSLKDRPTQQYRRTLGRILKRVNDELATQSTETERKLILQVIKKRLINRGAILPQARIPKQVGVSSPPIQPRHKTPESPTVKRVFIQQSDEIKNFKNKLLTDIQKLPNVKKGIIKIQLASITQSDPAAAYDKIYNLLQKWKKRLVTEAKPEKTRQNIGILQKMIKSIPRKISSSSKDSQLESISSRASTFHPSSVLDEDVLKLSEVHTLLGQLQTFTKDTTKLLKKLEERGRSTYPSIQQAKTGLEITSPFSQDELEKINKIILSHPNMSDLVRSSLLNDIHKKLSTVSNDPDNLSSKEMRQKLQKRQQLYKSDEQIQKDFGLKLPQGTRDLINQYISGGKRRSPDIGRKVSFSH